MCCPTHTTTTNLVHHLGSALGSSHGLAALWGGRGSRGGCGGALVPTLVLILALILVHIFPVVLLVLVALAGFVRFLLAAWAGVGG